VWIDLNANEASQAGIRERYKIERKSGEAVGAVCPASPLRLQLAAQPQPRCGSQQCAAAPATYSGVIDGATSKCACSGSYQSDVQWVRICFRS